MNRKYNDLKNSYSKELLLLQNMKDTEKEDINKKEKIDKKELKAQKLKEKEELNLKEFSVQNFLSEF